MKRGAGKAVGKNDTPGKSGGKAGPKDSGKDRDKAGRKDAGAAAGKDGRKDSGKDRGKAGPKDVRRELGPAAGKDRKASPSRDKGGPSSAAAASRSPELRHGPADEVPTPSTGDLDAERIRRMQETIAEILHNRTLARLHVGLRVMTARTGRLFYDRRGDALMDPASNQKVLATTTALTRLGADWRFRTEMTGPEPDDDGVVHGGIHLRGNGDPSLRAGDLDDLAARLRARGATRVEGGVFADARMLGDDAGNAGGDAGDAKAPLVVDRGLTVVRVRPGAAAGAPPVVLTAERRLASDNGAALGFVVHNQAVTKAAGRTRVTVRIGLADGRLRVDVAGRIALGSPGVAFRRRVPHPALHTAMMLRAALVGAGIAVRDPASTGPVPAAPGFVEVHESAPLAIVLRKINKDSDNEQAERVLQTVGAEVLGGPPSTEKGVAVLRAVIGSLGLRPSSYLPRNGSGLGHANRITPDAMADLLRALYLDPRVGPEILQSLSVGGVDGTTRNRFKGTLAAHRVRAKTGTLDGKSCLSGLVGDGDDVVVFSMMVQGFRHSALAAVRASQVGAVNAIMRYVREGSGERIELPAGFDEQVVGTDTETSGESEESDSAGDVEPGDGAPGPKPAPGEDAVDAFLRQSHAAAPASPPSSGAGGAGGAASFGSAPTGALPVAAPARTVAAPAAPALAHPSVTLPAAVPARPSRASVVPTPATPPPPSSAPPSSSTAVVKSTPLPLRGPAKGGRLPVGPAAAEPVRGATGAGGGPPR